MRGATANTVGDVATLFFMYFIYVAWESVSDFVADLYRLLYLAFSVRITGRSADVVRRGFSRDVAPTWDRERQRDPSPSYTNHQRTSRVQRRDR